MRLKKRRSLLTVVLVCCLAFHPVLSGMGTVQAENNSPVMINAVDYGADPAGIKDSTRAIQDAFAAAKEASENGTKAVTVSFPKGEYHIYKDYAAKREYHTSNTNSIENPIKTIGILIENQKNLTVDGNDSLFMMHGNMMALAVVHSENITLEDFSWDFAVPTVSEMTVVGMGTEAGKQYTDFYIPKCFPYEVTGNTIKWSSEPSPYTGQPYWTETGIHRSYAVVGSRPDMEMVRRYGTNESPFSGVSGIQKLDDTTVRITYQNARPQMQTQGMIIQSNSSQVRETAGAFTWESTNVTARRVKVHFMHGFGWLLQMSRDVYFYDCDMMPREDSGHITVSYADGIHASGAAGDLVIENCNFSNMHDDPINLHGTFTRVEERIDEHTLRLEYIHAQQGGFPQFHTGDKVAFFTRNTLESTDRETEYTVAEVVSNPGENGNDLRTMLVRFEESLPETLSEKISTEPKYVAENTTYAPEVTIRGCDFSFVPTRGILCTTRNKVLIENNKFLNMSMASIFLSNDSDQWYESGPIRDMTIRNNTFYITRTGQTEWKYSPAVYVHPVTMGGGLPSEDNPIHKNITIEGNTFHMDADTVVKAESVENLKILNNKIVRTKPNIKIQIEADSTQLTPGETMSLTTNATGKTNSGAVDNVFEFTKCKDVRLEGNTYDDGMKLYAVLSGMQESSLINLDPEIKVTNNVNGAASNPVQDICYASTNPDVASVDAKGRITARKEGTATVFAYYHWNDTIVRSNQVEVTVGKGAAGETQKVTIQGADNIQLTQAGETHAFEALVRPSGTAVWSVEDFETGNETDIAEIDENGVLTARKNGIVWVTASAGLSVDRRAVIITLPETDGLNPAFTVKRENADARTLGKDSAVIKMQKGDLYQKDNNVNNLFLYQVPESIAKDNLRTVIKVENLPVKEAGFWDTGSFLLYKDDDNYISVGKKSHFNGITRVVETGGSATETGGNSSENAVSTAYLGFYKNGSQVSLDFKLEGGQWQNVATVSDTTIGNDYQIGFATWGEASRNKELTYSDFHVASGDVSYEELCEQTPIVFTGMPNQAPTVSDAAFGAETYRVGDTAEVSYQYTDPEGDQEGRTLYCFSYGGTQEVTTEPRTVLKATGTITCTVYPVDVNGTPGVPVSAEAQVEAGEGPVELQELQFNSTILYQSGDSERDFEVKVPSELTMAQISYKMPGDGQNVRILVDGKPLQDSYPGNASVTLPIADGTSIQVKPSESSVYTIKISVVEDCTADAKRIAIPGLDFEESQPTEKSWFINTDRKEAELEVELNDQVGSLRVLRNDNREELEISREGGLYKIPMVFKTGINSFYIQVTAKDGITMNQYLIVANYDAPSDAAPEMIQVDGVDVEGFAADQKEYLVQVKEDAAEKGVKVSQGTAKRIQIIVNGVMTEGNQAEVTEWKQGMNEVSVIAWAADGIVKNIYQIHAFLPYNSNAGIYDIKVGQRSILDQFEGTHAAVDVVSDTIELSVQAQDERATITLSNGMTTYVGTGSLTKELMLYQETDELEIQILSVDGKQEENRTIKFTKAAYLSDMEYNAGATVGYGEIQKDKASSGSAIRVVGEDGNPVTYEKGIGTHADSEITYNIEEMGYQALIGWAGVDYAQYASANPAIEFTILADGEAVFESGVMNGTTPAKAFNISLAGISQITLKAVQAVNNFNAHADWADMKLTGQFDKLTSDKQYTQNIVQSPGGTIHSDVEGDIAEGSSVTYTFTPNQGYRLKMAFVNGTEAAAINGNLTILQVKENLTISAEFEKIPVTSVEYTAAFSGGTGASGTAPISWKAAQGSVYKLPANTFTKAGCKFAAWSDGVKTYPAGSNYTMPGRNVTFTAVWISIPGKTKRPAVKKVSASSVKLSWKAVKGASGYEVQRTVKGKKEWQTVKTLKGTSYTDKKLAGGTAYSFRVKAFAEAAGQKAYGFYSPAVSAVTKPTAPKMKAKVYKGRIKLTWNKKTGADKFQIYCKKGKGSFKKIDTINGKKRSYDVKTEKGAVYSLRIRGLKRVSKGKTLYSSYSRQVRVKAK